MLYIFLKSHSQNTKVKKLKNKDETNNGLFGLFLREKNLSTATSEDGDGDG